MSATSFNLTQPYYCTHGNFYHYNSLQSGNNHFRVDFTRVVSASGINIKIDLIRPSTLSDPLPTPQDTIFLINEVKTLLGKPRDGNECVALGWLYLGNWLNNQSNIEAAISVCSSKGYNFIPIYYFNGYFVYGCIEEKLFYDKGPII